MAEEEKNEKKQDEKAEEKAPEAEAQGKEETPKEPKAEAPQTGTPGAEGEEVPADEREDVPADGEAEAKDAPAEEEAPAEEGAPAAEEAPADDEGMDWKTRRRLERSRQSGEAGPQRKPEERAAERAQKRAGAIKSRSSYRRKSREGHQPRDGTPPAERRSAARKVRQGRVVSNKSEKTITVKIDAARRHPAYEKIIRHSSTLRAHDERNEAAEGDLVRVVETRPLSRTKRWRLVEVLEKAK
jgi:small subunit ribosomal protein S17